MLKDRIKKAREASGLGKLEFARAVGVTSGNVTHWENGATKSVKPENLFPMQDVSGFSARWIALGEGPQLLADAYNVTPSEVEAEKIVRLASLLSDKSLAHIMDTIELLSRVEHKDNN